MLSQFLIYFPQLLVLFANLFSLWNLIENAFPRIWFKGYLFTFHKNLLHCKFTLTRSQKHSFDIFFSSTQSKWTVNLLPRQSQASIIIVYGVLFPYDQGRGSYNLAHYKLPKIYVHDWLTSNVLRNAAHR